MRPRIGNQELATKNEALGSMRAYYQATPAAVSNWLRAGLRLGALSGKKWNDQAAAASATGAGFLVTSFSTMGENFAPTPRQ